MVLPSFPNLNKLRSQRNNLERFSGLVARHEHVYFLRASITIQAKKPTTEISAIESAITPMT